MSRKCKNCPFVCVCCSLLTKSLFAVVAPHPSLTNIHHTWVRLNCCHNLLVRELHTHTRTFFSGKPLNLWQLSGDKCPRSVSAKHSWVVGCGDGPPSSRPSPDNLSHTFASEDWCEDARAALSVSKTSAAKLFSGSRKSLLIVSSRPFVTFEADTNTQRGSRKYTG